jgi:hypothetical protein
MSVSNITRQSNLFSSDDHHQFRPKSKQQEVFDNKKSEEEQWIYRYRTQRSASVDSTVPILREPEKKREVKRYSPLRSKSKTLLYTSLCYSF